MIRMDHCWLLTVLLSVGGALGVARWNEDVETFRQLSHTVEQLADLNRNLEQQYRTLEFGDDFSVVVGNMIESLKEVQIKGEEMVEKIKVQEEKLQKVQEEIEVKESFGRSIDQKRKETEELAKKFEEELKMSEAKKIKLQEELEVLDMRKGEMSREVKSIGEVVHSERTHKEQEVARMKQELAEYHNKISEANSVLSEIQLAQEQSQKVPAKESSFPTPELFIPILLVSVLFNFVLGAQALDVADVLDVVPILSSVLDADTRLTSKGDSITEPLLQMAIQLSDRLLSSKEEDQDLLWSSPYAGPYDFEKRMDSDVNHEHDPIRILKKIKKEKDKSFGKKKSYARRRMGVGGLLRD